MPMKMIPSALPRVAVKHEAGTNETAVLDYFNANPSRPFSAIEVFSALQLSYPSLSKSSLAKMLTSLVNESQLTSKTFGKSVIYFKIQTNENIDTINENRRNLNLELSQVKQTYDTLNAQHVRLTAQLSDLNKSLPTDDMIRHVAQLKSQLDSLSARLALIKSDNSVGLVTKELIDETESQRASLRALWVQRKRWFKDMYDGVIEHLPVSAANDLFEDLDIVTDEKAGVSVTDVPSASSSGALKRGVVRRTAKPVAKKSRTSL